MTNDYVKQLCAADWAKEGPPVYQSEKKYTRVDKTSYW
jgi:hypothetical protein